MSCYGLSSKLRAAQAAALVEQRAVDFEMQLLWLLCAALGTGMSGSSRSNGEMAHVVFTQRHAPGQGH